MPDHVARLLTASWHSAHQLPASPHIHQVSDDACKGPLSRPALCLASVNGSSAANLRRAVISALSNFTSCLRRAVRHVMLEKGANIH